MKKRTIVIIGIIVAVIIAIILCICLRDRNIVGVTTYPKTNTVVMNCKTGDEFVSGSGKVTVGEDEHIHLDYELDYGSFDIALHKGDGNLSIFRDTDMSNLKATDEGGVFGTSNVSGKGSLDYTATPGDYTVFFTIHDTVGKATVSAVK